MRKFLLFLLPLFLTYITDAQIKTGTVEAQQSFKLSGVTYKRIPNIATSIQELQTVAPISGNTVQWIDSLQGGEFTVYPKGNFKIDSGMVLAHGDPNFVMLRNTSMTNYVNVKWYGAKGDGVTDDWAAIDRAIRSLRAFPSFNTGTFSGTLYFPGGTYRLTKPLALNKTIKLLGESGFIQESTRLLFDNGIDGIIECAPIAADGQHAAVGSAQGYSIEHLTITQDTTGAKTIGHGIWARVRGTINDVSVSNWAGDGVHIEANGTNAADYNKVLLVDVAQPGSYSTSTPPTVTIVPTNGGSGATAHAVMGGKITGLQIVDTGRHYVARPYIRIETTKLLDRNSMHTDGWGAIASTTMQLDTIVITNGGIGYTHATVQFTGLAITPATGEIFDSTNVDSDTTAGISNGTTSVAQVNIVNGQITGIVITNRGEYSFMPKIVITGDGTGATAKAYASLKNVYLNTITGGSWYEADNNLQISVYGGHEGDDMDVRDASFQVTSMGNWQLKRIEMDAVGDGYLKEPLVTLSGGNPITPGTVRAEIGRDRQGNANQFILEKVRSVANSNGFVARGSDVNAGNIIGCDFSYNKQMGITETSFLGNYYEAGHSTSNGVAPIYAISANGFNTFVNYYTEGNQPPIIALSPSVFIGGDLGSGLLQKPGVPAIKRDVAKLSSGINIQAQGTNFLQTIGIGDNPNAGTILRYGGTNLGNSYLLRQVMTGVGVGDVSLSYGTDGYTKGIYYLTGLKTAQKFGRDSAVPHAMVIHHLMLGSGVGTYANYRMLGYSNGLPTALPTGVKQWAVGDFVFNSNPNATTGILGWHRLTKGTANVVGTDWLAMSAGIQNQNTTLQPATVYMGSTLPSYLTNHGSVPVVPITAIPNSGWNFINRVADGYWSMFNLYTSGNTSGLHVSSPISNSSILATGGWYQQLSGITGNYMPLETSMSALAQLNGKLYFLNKRNLTPGVVTSLNTIAVLDEVGLSLLGSTPDAGLTLKAGTTIKAPLKFTAGPNLTTTQSGTMNYDGTNFYATPGSTIKRLPLQNDVTPSNGQVLLGNGTDFTVGSLTPGYGITTNPGAGSLAIGADTLSATGLVSKSRLNTKVDSLAAAGVSLSASNNWTGSKTTFSAAAATTANNGTLNVGGGAFDGTTTGFFSGSSGGTLIAANSLNSFTGRLADLQVGGNSKFFTNASGLGYFAYRLGINNTNPQGLIQLSGSSTNSAAFSTTGMGLVLDGGPFTSTSSTGTIALGAVHSIAIPGMGASSATTLTDAANLYIAGAPTASTNVTIAATHALYIGGGNVYMGAASTKLNVNRIGVGQNAYTTGALSSSGASFSINSNTITDNSTVASGTNLLGAIAGVASSTVGATNTGVTYAKLASLNIVGAPIAGTNVTITRPLSFNVAAGETSLAGLSTGYRASGINTTLTASDNLLEVTATGLTITLPDATTSAGREYVIKLTAAGTTTISTSLSQLIDGVATYTLSAQYKYVHLKSNGTGYLVTANN